MKELERKKKEEQRKVAAEQKKKQEAEQKRIAELKKKQAEEAKRLEKLKAEQQALERKKQEEQQRLAELERKRKAEEERKRKAEEERKRKEEGARRAEEERLRQQQLAEEQAMLAARRQAFIQSEVDRYMLLIQQRVESNWNRPSGWTAGTKCEVAIRVIPGARGGQVLDARMTRSCGNPLFDRTVETAVFNSSPIPLPTDPEVAAQFRDLNLIFNPED